jgi:hypothetical protein
MNTAFDGDLAALAIAIDTVIAENERKDKRIAELEQENALLLALVNAEQAARLAVAALQPERATNGAAQQLTPSGVSGGPQIAPETV